MPRKKAEVVEDRQFPEPAVVKTPAGKGKSTRIQGDVIKESADRSFHSEPDPEPPVQSDPELESYFAPSNVIPEPKAADEIVDPEKAETPESDDDVKLDKYTAEAAAQLGMNPEDYSSPQALQRAIVREYDRRAYQQPIQQSPPQKQPEKEPEYDPFEGIEEADQIDEPTKKVLKKMAAAQRAQIEQKYAPLEQANKQLQAVLEQQETRRIDDIFSSLKEDFGTVFGNGSLYGLGQGSPAWNARTEVFQTAQAISHRTGREVDSSLIKNVAKLLYGETPKDAATKVAADTTAASLRRRQSQFVGAPTQRSGEPLEPRAEGIEHIRRMLNGNSHARA